MTLEFRISTELQRIGPSDLKEAEIELLFDEHVNEIACAIGEDDRNATSRSVTINRKDGTNAVISTTSAAYEPLQYTLLFPTGELGWGADTLCLLLIQVSSIRKVESDRS